MGILSGICIGAGGMVLPSLCRTLEAASIIDGARGRGN
jgi:hypothetical protein